MADLIPPHGGLTEPVDRTVAQKDRAVFASEAAGLSKVPVSDADLSTLYRFGDGALSPLTGPMDRATYDRVLDESVIEHAGKKYAWTIPLSLPVTADVAAGLSRGQKVALTSSSGDIVATLDISDVFE
jgi:sulfate adenylyltransferase